MKIAVIGTGNVGGALGKGWAKKGHSVTFGVRDKADEKLKSLLKEAGPNAGAASVQEAAAFGEVVVFATPWSATQDAIRSAGDLNGKIVFECNNPVKPDLSGLQFGQTTSAAEQVASWAPGAKVVKVFNTTGAGNMANSHYPDGPPAMFYCGNDPGAKKVAAQLASDLGFEPIDAGEITSARLLEPLAMLWIRLAYAQGLGPNFAFRIIRR
ncbi:MAG TPA: NADPH-dependent F420 reductase [Terriglobales bacterium]|nr:NADPH-dependent F420 reductase [Terriglobales bacterium]